MSTPGHTQPSADDTGDRDVPSGADAPPTPEQEEAADRAAETAPDVGEAFDAAAERGANIEGEGQIED